MALNLDPSPVGQFLEGMSHPAALENWARQLGVAVVAVGLGWLVAHRVCAHMQASRRWKFGKGGFERVAFPLFTLAFASLGRFLLGHYQVVALLQLLQSLIVAWLTIRVAVYVLGHIIPEGAFLRTVVRIIGTVAWVAVLLHMAGLLGDVIDALDDIGFTFGKEHQRITLWLVLQGAAALALTLAVTLWIGRITETRVLAAETIEMSTRIVISKLVRAGAVLVALLVALPLVGIDVTTLSVFSGALGVGLGFGLQKIASNYVSGFIVLLDRSLRIGDIVTVDNRRGEVKAIESRYTVIKGADGVESIIPNETLITQSVNHHTYSDPKVSVVVDVSVAYETDVDLACRLLVQVARSQARIISEPPVAARVKNLAADGIELALTVWISDPAVGEAELRSDLLKGILKAFKEHGVEIPYPRRDVRLIATPETRETPAASRG